MEQLVTRVYNRFEVDNVRGVIRKLSSTERLRDEILYYKMLEKTHPDKSVYFPRLLDSIHHVKNDYWMDLELYDYPNLGNYLLADNMIPSWETLFKSLLNILQDWSTIHPTQKWSDEEVQSAAYSMYIEKTEKEFNNFYDGWNDKFECLFADQVKTHTLIINKKQYSTFEVIWPRIKLYITQHMLDFTPSMIHGDCCFSNILYGADRNIIRFIDPRGSFGKVGMFGDIRYDVAKLQHSVDGLYEAFITDKFKVSSHGNIHQLDIRAGSVAHEEINIAHEAFHNTFFPAFNLKEIKIIQGCIFIGMCARHYDNIDRQHAMYLTGIRLLNEALSL
jgi:hypothetical protein